MAPEVPSLALGNRKSAPLWIWLQRGPHRPLLVFGGAEDGRFDRHIGVDAFGFRAKPTPGLVKEGQSPPAITPTVLVLVIMPAITPQT